MRRRLAKGSRVEAARGRAEAARRKAAPRLLAASRLIVACLLLAGFDAPGPALARARDTVVTDGFTHAELPSGGEVRVENRLGGVSVELWNDPHVGVAADVDGVAYGGDKPPFSLLKTANSLTVVVAAASAPRAKVKRRVDLRLRVPAEARLSVFTADGAVEVSGNPARLDAQTVSGDLRLLLAGDADVMARTLAGTITVRAGLVAAESAERVVHERFNARLGAGSRLVRLSTARGRIELAPLVEGEPGATGSAARLSNAPRPPAQTSNAGNETEAGARRAAADARQRQTPVAAASPAAETEANAGARRPELRTAAPQQQQTATPPVARRPPTIVGARDAQQPARPAPAPTPPAEGPIEIDPDEIITVDTHVVTLNLSVVDRQSGRGLSGLTRDDFRVAENGVEQQITNFETANAPFDLLLLLDLSGSTAKVTEVIRASALRFVESVRAGDRVGIVAFAAAPQVVSELTDDRRLLRSRVATMGAPTGDTKLYDAVAFAVEHLEKNSPKTRRRAVVLMSDGLDSVLPNVQGDGSALTYDEVRSRVQEFDGLFYTVWTDTSYEALSPLDVQPETFDLVYDRMEELAKVGGGLFYEVEKLEDLAGAYERVVQDLGTVYSVSYLPIDKTRDGRWRAVRVRLPRRPEAVARGRSGYFAK